MYKYLVAFTLLTPLIGIILIERGEWAVSIGVEGTENGASIAFAAYALLLATVARLVVGRTKPLPEPTFDPSADAKLMRVSLVLLVSTWAFLIVFLFGFGAIGIWTGGIGKAELRTSLGPFGAIPNLTTKFVVPALLCYSALVYRKSTKSFAIKAVFFSNVATAFFLGASWGFKSTSMMMMLPMVLVLNWSVTKTTLIKLGILFIASLALFFQLFDSGDLDANVQSFLLTRITVLQGDVSWHIWGMAAKGETFPNYWPTLFAAVGDKALATFIGLGRDDSALWMQYHYDVMITWLSGAPFDQIEDGYNVTATPFSEGLVAGGIPGLIGIAIFGGVLVGVMYALIDRALRRQKDIAVAFAATYFCFHVFTWLNGGGVVALFHISLLLSFGATWMSLDFMRRVRFGVVAAGPRA